MNKEQEPRMELLATSPQYKEWRRKFGAEEPQEVKELKTQHDLRLFIGALFISIAFNIGTCYSLASERQERIQADQNAREYDKYLVDNLNRIERKIPIRR